MPVLARRFLGALLILGTLGHPIVRAQSALTLGLIPMERAEVVAGQWRPMLDHIEKHLGLNIRMDFSESYSEVQRKYEAGRLHLVYVGPLLYTELRQRDPQTTAIVHFKEKSGASTYTCSIFTAVPMRLRDLKGKRIAVIQPLSTCGHLTMEHLLRQEGLSLEQTRFRYFQQHDAAALAVVQGQFDAAGVKTSIGLKYAHLGLHPIAESVAFPGLALVANRRIVDPDVIARLKALLTTTTDAQRTTWGDNLRHGASEAFDKDYDTVRAMKSRIRVPEQDSDR